MVCLGFEPGAAGQQAQTKPDSYVGHPQCDQNFCKVAKIFNFSSAIIVGQLLQTFGDFCLVTLATLHSAFLAKHNFFLLRFYIFVRIKFVTKWEVVVAQLVERSVPEVHCSNPVIGKNLYIEHLFLSIVYKRRK